MAKRLIEFMGVVAVIIGVIVLLTLTKPVVAQAPTAANKAGAAAKAGAAPKTAWGEPNLQGIWTDEFQTPLQRPAKYAAKEFFTDAERAEVDRQRRALLRRDTRAERGSEKDVAGAYNAVFQSIKPTGKRTSLVVDPPDGRIPPTTAEAKQKRDADRAFFLALMQNTETCKKQEPGCAGGTYGPPSVRRDEVSPRYNTGRLNRYDGPEDANSGFRCMSSVLPDFTGYRRIVQSPGSVSIFYDVGQGQGWQRVIPIDGSAHLSQSIRQRFGDSRGRWEGNTLVVDVANFTPKWDFQGARENLHLVERWTRVDANTIEYAVTIEDPTTWTRSWTVKQEMNKQDEQANRIYYEPRCHEGNYGLAGALSGERAIEKAFTEGTGPHPATRDQSTCFTGDAGDDPLGPN